MQADDIKKKFFDITPPTPAKPSFTKQDRTIIAAEPARTDETTPHSEDTAPIQVRRETVIKPVRLSESPMISDIAPIAQAAWVKQPELVTEQLVFADSKNNEVAESSYDSAINIEASLVDVENQKTQLTSRPANVEQQKSESLVPPTENTLESNEPDWLDEPVLDTFPVVDALPDEATQRANDAKNDHLQSPHIYDTNKYHIPIKDTHHGHGGVGGALLFGTFFAVAVLAGIVVLALKMGA